MGRVYEDSLSCFAERIRMEAATRLVGEKIIPSRFGNNVLMVERRCLFVACQRFRGRIPGLGTSSSLSTESAKGGIIKVQAREWIERW